MQATLVQTPIICLAAWNRVCCTSTYIHAEKRDRVLTGILYYYLKFTTCRFLTKNGHPLKTQLIRLRFTLKIDNRAKRMSNTDSNTVVRRNNGLVIRVWQPGDEKGVWEVLKEGSFSNVPLSFLIVLQKKGTTALILVPGLLVLGYTGYFFAGVFTVSLCLYLIYCCLWFVAVFYLYGPPLSDMKEVKKNYLTDKDCNFWVAVIGGKIVGTIAIEKRDRHGSKSKAKQDTNGNRCLKVAWLRRMAVLSSCRGNGVARCLVRVTIDFCESRKYDQIELITTEVHRAARKLYEKCGFVCRAFRPYKYIYGLVRIWTYEYELNISNKNPLCNK